MRRPKVAVAVTVAAGMTLVAAAVGVAAASGVSPNSTTTYTPGNAPPGKVRTLLSSSSYGLSMGPMLQLPDGSILTVQTLHMPAVGDDDPPPLDRSLVLLLPDGHRITVPEATLDGTRTGPQLDPITADATGDAYVVDRYHDRILELSSARTLTAITKASDSAGISGDGGKAIDAAVGDVTAATVGPDGSLYLTAFPEGPHRVSEVRRITPEGSSSRSAPSRAISPALISSACRRPA